MCHVDRARHFFSSLENLTASQKTVDVHFHHSYIESNRKEVIRLMAKAKKAAAKKTTKKSTTTKKKGK